jgi:hypothetical protein
MVAAAIVILQLSPPARAQAPAAVAPAAPAPTAAELEELNKALNADTAKAPSPAAVAPSGAAGSPGGFGAMIQSMNPNLSLILDVAGAAFSKDPSGLEAGDHDPRVTGITLQAFEMAFDASVDPYLRFQANLVVTSAGIEIEEAYGATTSLPWNLQVRAGVLLTRFGRLNPTHPHTWSFLDMPLVNSKFLSGDGSRGPAVELSWLAPLPWYVELVGEATMANDSTARSFWNVIPTPTGPDGKPTASDLTLQNDLKVGSAKDLLYSAAIKQFFPMSDAWSLAWGLSGMWGPNATYAGARSAIYGTDLYLRWRPVGDPERRFVAIQAEGMYRTRESRQGTLEDWGAYGQVTWQFFKRWETGARYDFVSGLANDYLDPEWNGPRHRVAAQITFYPSHFSRIRLQGSMDRPIWTTRDELIWSGMLGLEVAVGAHGAHAF